MGRTSPRSIRSYLLTRLCGGAALVLAVAGVAVYLVVARALEANFDTNLSDRVQALASILFQEGDEVDFAFSQELMPEFAREELPDYFELWFADGRLLERSESLLGQPGLEYPTPDQEPTHWTAPLPDGREGRYVAQLVEVHHIYPEEGPNRPTPERVRIVIAGGREELVTAELSVMLQCLLASLVLMVTIAVLSWTAVKRGLEPANRLARALDAIEVDRLPESLDAGELPAELEPVAATTDALIRRVDAALERERRTTADIAHELRTPITEMLTASEVALRNGRDPEGARRALSTVRDVAWRMGRSVSTLLELARLEMGVQTFEREDVPLAHLVEEVLRSLSSLRRERDLRVENRVDSGLVVDEDRVVLRIVVANLLGNALYYAPPGSVVTCDVEESGDGWRLTIENLALDLGPEDLRVLTEPFWRKDGSRSDRKRSGLGLALSRALAEKSGLCLSFGLDERVFRAILERDQAPRTATGLRSGGSNGTAGRRGARASRIP